MAQWHTAFGLPPTPTQLVDQTKMTPRLGANRARGLEQRRPAISDTSILAAAMHYMQAGWRIIPLHRVGPDGKTCSCKDGGKCASAGKHPKSLDWSQAEKMSAADVHATWDTKYAPNLGVVTGDPSGFWVLDIDGEVGKASMTKLIEAHKDQGAVPKTLLHKTGSGGYHFIFPMVEGFQPKTVSNALGKAYPGIDVRGVGGQIVLPPSRSAKGIYTVSRDATLLPAPAWLIALLPQVTDVVELELDDEDLAEHESLDEYDRGVADRYVDAAVGGVIKDLEAVTRPWEEGAGWDQATHRAACRLFELAQQSWSKLTYREAFELLAGHAPQDSEWGAAEINAKWLAAQTSVGKKPMPRPRGKRDDNDGWGDLPVGSPKAPAVDQDAAPEVRPRTWDDFGNAERLNDRHPRVIKWIEEAGVWAHYDGTAWRMDRMNQVSSMAHDVLVHLVDDESLLYSDVVEEEEKVSMRDQFVSWAGKQRMYARLEATLKTARSLRPLAAHMTDFDADPMILNCRNAAVDLRTGALIPHSPELMAMHQASVEYDPDAKAPQWDAFLERVLPSAEMRAFLARAVGYTLNGLTGEQVMFMHHGSGANGKSVFLKVMEEILGDYAQTVPRTTLLTSKNEGIPTDVARMVGKRFLQTSETAAGRRLDEEVIKGLTGGEKQTARFLHRDFFDFTPTGTIHYVTNHLPRLTNAESIWRRLILIGWNVVIPAEERDQHLADRIIRDEAAGVLAWAIRGAVDYQEKRLAIPDECRVALEQYREDVDMLGDFISECLIVGLDSSINTPVARIYNEYQAWCFRSGVRNPMVLNDLSAALVERKFERSGKDGRKFVDGKQQRCFSGVGILTTARVDAS